MITKLNEQQTKDLEIIHKYFQELKNKKLPTTPKYVIHYVVLDYCFNTYAILKQWIKNIILYPHFDKYILNELLLKYNIKENNKIKIKIIYFGTIYIFLLNQYVLNLSNKDSTEITAENLSEILEEQLKKNFKTLSLDKNILTFEHILPDIFLVIYKNMWLICQMYLESLEKPENLTLDLQQDILKNLHKLKNFTEILVDTMI